MTPPSDKDSEIQDYELFKGLGNLLQPLLGLEEHLDEFVSEIAEEIRKCLKVEAALEHCVGTSFHIFVKAWQSPTSRLL